IALPLQTQARECGNTVFLDEQFSPHPDQWRFLASVTRVSRGFAETLVRDAESKGRVIGVRLAIADDDDDDSPWMDPPSRHRKDPPILDPLPDTLELVLADQIYVARENLPPTLRNRLL